MSTVQPQPPAIQPPILMPPMYAPSWPRWRRLKFTGSENHRHTRGRYALRRRLVEADLARMVRQLHPAKLIEKILRLRPETRDQVTQLLGWLTGDNHPDRWALPDDRPEHDPRWPRWYLSPRGALQLAHVWLRKARELHRLIFFNPALIESMSAPLYKERIERGKSERRRSPAEEIARLRAYCQARGIPWIGTAEGREGQ